MCFRIPSILLQDRRLGRPENRFSAQRNITSDAKAADKGSTVTKLHKRFCQTTNDIMGSMMDEDQWARWVRQAENRVQKLWETNQGGKLLAESKEPLRTRKILVKNV
jgi:hypothetical protein